MAETFGKFLLFGQVAVGGMAEIYKAKFADPSMPQDDIALKRILPSYTEDEAFVTMFKDEGQIAQRLQHPNIIKIYDVGEVDNDWYIAMEFIKGTDVKVLSDACEKHHKRFTPTQTARIICDTAKALYYAHSAKDENGEPMNIVHRDCTPHNIMVSQEGKIKLMDFGIAKAASRATKTRVGTVKGKSAYMSPEQARGKELDGRSDMFTLGTVGWEMLCGYRLFKAQDDFKILMKVLKAEIIHPSDLDSKVPRDLGDIMMKTLQRNRDDRYPTCKELADDLENWIATRGDGSDAKIGDMVLALTGKQGHSHAELPNYEPGESCYDCDDDGNFTLKPGATPGGAGAADAGAPKPEVDVPSFAQQGATLVFSMASTNAAVMPKKSLPLSYILAYAILFLVAVGCAIGAVAATPEDRSQEDEIIFKAPDAFVTFKTRPAGATVSIDGEIIRDENDKPAKTPLMTYKSTLGKKLNITFRKDDYAPVTIERDVTLTNQEIEVVMMTEEQLLAMQNKSLDKIKITTVPKGLTVSVNGEEIGPSPVTITDGLTYGSEIAIEVSGKGYEGSQTIIITKDTETDMEIKAEKAKRGGKKKGGDAAAGGGTGTLSLSAKPWAIVSVDGKSVGNVTAAPKSQKFKAGAHTVKFNLPQKRAEQSKKVTLKPGQTLKIGYDFNKNSWM